MITRQLTLFFLRFLFKKVELLGFHLFFLHFFHSILFPQLLERREYDKGNKLAATAHNLGLRAPCELSHQR